MATGIQVPYIVEVDATTAGGAVVYELIHAGTIIDAAALCVAAGGTLLIERAAYNPVTDTYGAYASICAAFPVPATADFIQRAGAGAASALLAAECTCGQFDRIRVTAAGAGNSAKLFLTVLAPQQQ
jgi:hypothetical protein